MTRGKNPNPTEKFIVRGPKTKEVEQEKGVVVDLGGTRGDFKERKARVVTDKGRTFRN